MLKGLIVGNELIPSPQVLNQAFLWGNVEGYPLTVLAQMLDVYDNEHPSASQISGGSWRRSVLERIVDYYADPAQLIAMLRGTLFHKGLQGVAVPITISTLREKRITVNLPHNPKVIISGQVDVYYPQVKRLEDYKTTHQAPSYIKDEHLYQLAIYYWLLRWSGLEVNQVAIDYISWNNIVQVNTMEGGGLAIQHPYFQDSDTFENYCLEGWEVLNKGYTKYFVPSMKYCNRKWCSYCPVYWACETLPTSETQINPRDLDQRKVM